MEKFEEGHFIKWILQYRKADGTLPSQKCLDGHKSALFNLFRDFDLEESDEFKQVWVKITKKWRQLARKRALEQAQKGVRPGEGKDALPFDLLRVVSFKMLSLGTKDMVFACALLHVVVLEFDL